ncbi:hypothetical protein BMS3Abin15_00022 [bacterium BMS3Abin15]|nr:hypothetical protein BMS3Abin15_00022 [bacterium BMS3Abin15]
MIVAAPTYAEKSGNISLNEDWNVWYERGWSDEPVVFHFENITDRPAFKIRALVNCYDRDGKYLGRVRFEMPGPIHKYLIPKQIVPKGTKKMEAEVYNSWEYAP